MASVVGSMPDRCVPGAMILPPLSGRNGDSIHRGEVHHRIQKRWQDPRGRTRTEGLVHVPLLTGIAGMSEGRPHLPHAAEGSIKRFANRKDARFSNEANEFPVVGQEVLILYVFG